MADPPQDPCEHNPTTLCDGTIRVTVEAAGENCEFGGIKVVVQHGKLDGSEDPVEQGNKPTTEPEIIKPPKEDPPDETFFVCNGAPGPAGPQGPQGPAGPAGPKGDPGTTTIVTQPAPKKCQPSARILPKMIVPARLARFSNLQVTIRGFGANDRTASVRSYTARVLRRSTVPGPFVRVAMRDRHCGSFLVTAARPGSRVDPLVQVWQVTGLFGLRRTTLTG